MDEVKHKYNGNAIGGHLCGRLALLSQALTGIGLGKCCNKNWKQVTCPECLKKGNRFYKLVF